MDGLITGLKRHQPLTNPGMMEEIMHQLRLVVYPIIYYRFYVSQVVVWDFWTINGMEQVSYDFC